jgi:hypothetical protein
MTCNQAEPIDNNELRQQRFEYDKEWCCWTNGLLDVYKDPGVELLVVRDAKTGLALPACLQPRTKGQLHRLLDLIKEIRS